MNYGIRANLIDLWLRADRGAEFFGVVLGMSTRVAEEDFALFLDVWEYATDGYKTALVLPTLTVRDDKSIALAWSDSDHDEQFTVEIGGGRVLSWFLYVDSTGWSHGYDAEDEPGVDLPVSEIPLDMVTRWFKLGTR